MAKEISAFVKLQVKGGQANPAPPVGPALGSKGVNIMEFCKQFNARTQDKMGKVLPVIITVYTDKSFDFVIKTPPASVQLMEAAKIQKGSKESNRNKVGKVTWAAGRSNCQRQNARPELLYTGKRHENGSRYCTQHGLNCRRHSSMAIINSLTSYNLFDKWQSLKKENWQKQKWIKTKHYSLKEASALVKEVNTAKFDASVDLHIRLGVDPKKADQQVRGTVTLATWNR